MDTIEYTKDTEQYGFKVDDLIACHECDLLHSIQAIPAKGKALCVRCGALLYKYIPNSIDRALALYLSAFMLFILTNVFPFISLKLGGRIEENIMVSGAMAFYRLGMGELSILVLLTSFLFPLITIIGMLYVLFSLKYGYRPWKMAKVFRLARSLMPWSLLSVFMLGVLISYVKLVDLATVVPGVSLFSFAALLVVYSAAYANLDVSQIWRHMKFVPTGNGRGGDTASGQGMVSCHMCSLLVPEKDDDGNVYEECPRCEGPIHSRKANSVTRTWALIVTSALLFIPANLYPVMSVTKLGRGEPSTIINGVVHLIHGGMWILAMIIFFASIIVPTLKLMVLSFLLISVKRKSNWRTKDRALLFRVTEAVGAWSMVDIYAVAILIGLVNFGPLANVSPGIGATFFGAVVVTTMFAAHSFDPRLIWDNSEKRT